MGMNPVNPDIPVKTASPDVADGATAKPAEAPEPVLPVEKPPPPVPKADEAGVMADPSDKQTKDIETSVPKTADPLVDPMANIADSAEAAPDEKPAASEEVSQKPAEPAKPQTLEEFLGPEKFREFRKELKKLALENKAREIPGLMGKHGIEVSKYGKEAFALFNELKEEREEARADAKADELQGQRKQEKKEKKENKGDRLKNELVELLKDTKMDPNKRREKIAAVYGELKSVVDEIEDTNILDTLRYETDIRDAIAQMYPGLEGYLDNPEFTVRILDLASQRPHGIKDVAALHAYLKNNPGATDIPEHLKEVADLLTVEVVVPGVKALPPEVQDELGIDFNSQNITEILNKLSNGKAENFLTAEMFEALDHKFDEIDFEVLERRAQTRIEARRETERTEARNREIRAERTRTRTQRAEAAQGYITSLGVPVTGRLIQLFIQKGFLTFQDIVAELGLAQIKNDPILSERFAEQIALAENIEVDNQWRVVQNDPAQDAWSDLG